MLNFNNLFNQTQMINIPNQFICIYHINPKDIRYHQGQPKPQLKQVQLTLLPFNLNLNLNMYFNQKITSYTTITY